MYRDIARENGFDFELGQNQATVRWLQLAETEEKALEALGAYDAEIQKNFYNQLAFAGAQARAAAGIPAPARTQEPAPLDTPVADFVRRLDESEQHANGTVDRVRDQLVQQWQALPAEYIVLITHFAQQPLDSVVSGLDTFMREIKPALDELTPYATD